MRRDLNSGPYLLHIAKLVRTLRRVKATMSVYKILSGNADSVKEVPGLKGKPKYDDWKRGMEDAMASTNYGMFQRVVRRSLNYHAKQMIQNEY